MSKNCFKIFIFLFCMIININNVNAGSLEEYENEDTGYKVIVEDDANLLTNDELNKLKNEMIPLTKYGNIAFKTTLNNSDTTEKYASNYYHNLFGQKSGTLFLVDMDNRIIYIFSDGRNYKIITKDKAEIITDNVYRYASNEEYYECASRAFNQINTLLEGGKISEPMRYIGNFFISITLAFFINFIVVLIGTNVRKARSKEILDSCNITFNINQINAVKVGTHKVYSPSSSSSGGSSSGGRSSGGGSSSGGGGGHRF